MSSENRGLPMISNKPSPQSLQGQIWASSVAVACLLRGLPLFFAATPKTPLRVLCLIAFDTLHVLRTSQPLPRHRVQVLAKVLDLGACTNAALDRKRFCPEEHQAAWRWITNAGVATSVDEYLRQLRELERRRPLPAGDHRRFEEVRSYRERVARLSLGAISAIALGDGRVEDGIVATRCDHDLATLFRIVMLCQIIDDVLDYVEDISAGLPSFLTAAASLPQGLAWTTEAARSYAAFPAGSRSIRLFPLRLALLVVSMFTMLIIRASRWQHRWMRHSGAHTKTSQKCGFGAAAGVDASGDPVRSASTCPGFSRGHAVSQSAKIV